MIATLGNYVELASGGTPNTGDDALWDGTIPWVSSKDMKSLYLTDAQDHVSDAAIGNGTRLAVAGTILMVVRSMILAREVPIAVAKRDLAFNQDLKAITPRAGVDQGWLLYWLLAHRDQLKGIADEAAHGTKRIQTDRLLALPIAVPPLPTQRRIADILSAYDDLIELNQRRIAILEEMARRLFEEYFVRFRYPGHEHVKFTDGLPEGWTTSGIEEAYGGLFDGPHATPAPSDEGPVFLGIKNIRESGGLDLSSIRHVSEADFPQWTRRITPQEGDIVFSYEATLNLYALVPRGLRCCLGRRMALIRPKEEYRYFLFLHMLSNGWRRVIAARILSGATVDRIPLTTFPKFPLTLPPRMIAASFGETVGSQLKMIETLREQNQKLTQVRDLLLPKLISGEIDVSAAPAPDDVARSAA